jgi:hypothetical protein
MTLLKRRSVKWFLWSGCIGLSVATIIIILKPTNPAIIFALWPTSIIGLASPTNWLDQLVATLVMFGGNFLLYGAFGAIAGAASDRLER